MFFFLSVSFVFFFVSFPSPSFSFRVTGWQSVVSCLFSSPQHLMPLFLFLCLYIFLFLSYLFFPFLSCSFEGEGHITGCLCVSFVFVSLYVCLSTFCSYLLSLPILVFSLHSFKTEWHIPFSLCLSPLCLFLSPCYIFLFLTSNLFFSLLPFLFFSMFNSLSFPPSEKKKASRSTHW